MEKFWKSIAIGAVLLLVLVVGTTLVLAQDGDDAEPPAVTDPAEGESTDPDSTLNFGPRGGMPHGRGGMHDEWMSPDAGGDWGGRGGMMRGPGLALDIVADALEMTVEDVRTELAAGISIADLAAGQNVDVQIVIDALLADHEAALNDAVENGRLTQEQADAMQANAVEHITDMVNRSGNAGPCGSGRMLGGRGGRGGGMWQDGGAIPQRNFDTGSNL